jgi:hypothetical protein
MVVILRYEKEKLNEKKTPPKTCKNFKVAKRKEKFKGKGLKQMTHGREGGTGREIEHR